jgi:catechol 2,3-dioxygenase-like lactoylglutathione lyase family enzyme
MIKAKLNHVNINVSDLDRSLRFYQDAFGLKVAFWGGAAMVFLVSEQGGDMLTLCKAADGEPIAGGGVSHFGFCVGAGKMDEAVAQVEKAGGKLRNRGKHSPTEPFAYFSDPDGYVIELGE